jgi:hypothetical protein
MGGIIAGLLVVLVGGYILLMFGNVVIQSFWDKRVRDDLLSDPRVRAPTLFHKLAFAGLAALLLMFAGWLVLRGLSVMTS